MSNFPHADNDDDGNDDADEICGISGGFGKGDAYYDKQQYFDTKHNNQSMIEFIVQYLIYAYVPIYREIPL